MYIRTLTIPGFSGYVATEDGCVYSLKRKQFLRKERARGGYLRIRPRADNGAYVHCLVHRLIAQTFIENPEKKPQIDHIDGNPSNNSVVNLRWATPSENIGSELSRENHRKAAIRYFKAPGAIDLHKSRHPGLRIVCVNTGVEYPSCHEAGRVLNIHTSDIHRAATRGTKTHGLRFVKV